MVTQQPLTSVHLQRKALLVLKVPLALPVLPVQTGKTELMV